MAKVDDQNKKMKNEKEAEAPIHGDVLQAIFSHVPLVDLIPACLVSKAWNRDVFTSLHLNKSKPWLIVHTQRRASPQVTTKHAYDPRAHVWMEIKQQPSFKYASALKSSHSNLLYMLSSPKFAFSFDPLHLKWHHVEAPRVWRMEPVVAVVGHNVVVAGGACDFEDDPLSVEMYNLETRTWETCENMPLILKESASSTWLSIAVNSHKIYVSEKRTGVSYSFDPQGKRWHGPYDLRPDKDIIYSVITFAKHRLILVGLTGVGEDVESVKVWEVKGDSWDEFKEMGEMPIGLVKKLKKGPSNWIEVTSTGDSLYIHNISHPEELVVCEIDDDREDEYCCCQWSSIKNLVVNDDVRIMDRLAFTCSNVGMGDLRRALVNGKLQICSSKRLITNNE